jgi:hypothetical protein
MILQNHGVSGRHWVSLELAGTKSNRMAIGARVKIVAGGMTQTEEVRSGGSYISQSDFRLHFGLGLAEKIESLEVRWPSGKVETFKNLAADRFYALLEGEGIVPAERIRPDSQHRAASKPNAAGTPMLLDPRIPKALFVEKSAGSSRFRVATTSGLPPD